MISRCGLVALAACRPDPRDPGCHRAVEVPGGPGRMVGHSGGAQGCRAIVAYLPAAPAFVAVMISDELPAEAGLFALVQAARA